MPHLVFIKTTPHSLIDIAMVRRSIHTHTIIACVFARIHVVQSIASDSRRIPLVSSDFDTFARETARLHSEGVSDEEPFAGLSESEQEAQGRI